MKVNFVLSSYMEIDSKSIAGNYTMRPAAVTGKPSFSDIWFGSCVFHKYI